MTRVLPLVALISLAITPSATSAQVGSVEGIRAQREATPPDPLTAVISGRITTAETGAPLRRAEVRIVGPRSLQRLTTTDEEGRYVLRNLPSGSFAIYASKTGFVPLEYGQRRPAERRTPVSLSVGQRFTANVALPRAGAITGRIVDAAGEPVLGVRVQAMRTRVTNGTRGLQGAGQPDTTDDTGAYRVYGLLPGDYYLAVQEARTGLPENATPTGASLYYPGTLDRSLAQAISVDVSGEARADMQLVPIRTSRVAGTVLTSAGQPAARALVSLYPGAMDAVQTNGLSVPPLIQMVPADANGRFVLNGVPPGTFTLQVEHSPSPTITDRIEASSFQNMDTGELPIVVDGDVNDLIVTTSAPATADVSVTADRGITAPLPRGVELTLRLINRGSAITLRTGNGSNQRLALSWSGPARLAVSGLPSNWALKAILFDGEDVTDRTFEPHSGRNSLVQIVLTDRATEVTGTIAASSFRGEARAAEVVIFPADAQRWTYPSRYVRAIRVEQGNTFTVGGLPPGDDYRIVAVDYLEDGEENDPELLARLRDRAGRFALKDGERIGVEVRLVQR